MDIRTDGSTYLRAELVAVETGPLPALYLDVELSADEFTGRNPRVGIEREALSSFIGELDTMLRQRAGRASVEGMSPGTFSLALEYLNIRPSSHISGPILLSATLQRHVFLSGAGFPVNNVIEVHFDAPPEAIARALDALRAIQARVPAPQ